MFVTEGVHVSFHLLFAFLYSSFLHSPCFDVLSGVYLWSLLFTEYFYLYFTVEHFSCKALQNLDFMTTWCRDSEKNN